MTQATLVETNACGRVLYMVLELSSRTWKVLFRSPDGRQRERSVGAGDVAKLMGEIAEAKRQLGVPADARVASCYEAGRDGFWLHRALVAGGVDNLVVDSSSIEVPRRARHKKTDRLDLRKLMSLLLRYLGGERGAWSMVRVPDAEVEDVRQLARSIERLKSERNQHRTRLKSLLVKEGLPEHQVGRCADAEAWVKWVESLRRWDGSPVPPNLKRDLIAEGERLALVERQLGALKAEREALVAASASRIAGKTRALRQLGAIAEESSFLFATELFGWRTFANRRELAGAVGVTGTPYCSGESDREQGISKAGNRRMRAMLIEIAWGWLKYQPASALARWWQDRFAGGNKRTRRIGIVALARKLLIALWRYLEEGLVPEGARMKTLKRRRAAA